MLRVYLFWYKDLPLPVRIETTSKERAREMLIDLLPKLPEVYRYTEIVNETIETLVSGISEKIQGGKKFIFFHDKGWQPVNDQQLNDK
jgi:hypothetical protein